MKKLNLIVAAMVVAGSVSGWAQTLLLQYPNSSSNEADQILVGPIPITFKGQTSIEGAAYITSSTLAGLTPNGATSTLEFAKVVFGPPTSTVNRARLWIGTGIALVQTNLPTDVPGTTNNVHLVGDPVLQSQHGVDLSAAGARSTKFVSYWTETGAGISAAVVDTNYLSSVEKVISNAMLLVTGTLTDPSDGGHSTTNVTAKVTGIWVDDYSIISASIRKPTP
jgi:hypothetical protein